ncbi:unnamed protein product [Polarella glacialis]|uniref:Uncharacterized protein n=1 Tax=Polarella glacialis TaxID=89957 RepID=A0A813KLX1_POLGL|nr:unnamed protein product [Polarella glacialis]CAE8703785.1 unnamed protein product [Polarella glacialis]
MIQQLLLQLWIGLSVVVNLSEKGFLGSQVLAVMATSAEARSLAAIETQGFKSPVLTEQAVRGEIDAGRAILNQKASSQDKEVVLSMPQQISELAHATSSLVGRVASAFRVVPPPAVIRDVTQHAIGAVLFKTRLKPRYLGATSEATAVNAIAARHIPLWQASPARPTTGPPAMLPIQPMPGTASPLPVMPLPVPPSPPRPKPQAPGGVPPPVPALNFSQVFTKLRSSVLTLMLTAIGSLMLLVMQYYPLGLALLGFTAALLYEKLTSMGMMFVSVATALGSGVASAAIDAQWNTVLFWSVCLTFVGLLVLGKQLSDYVRGVKPDEPLLPS